MEVTTVLGCRVQCTFCPQSLLMNRYKEKNNLEKLNWGQPDMMSFETFKTCIDKIPKNVEIHFSGFAEPWLNPDCTKMLLYAHELGHEIHVYTTLVGMTVSDVELFKHIPFKKFSIHLPDTEKFAKIAINSQYVQVLRKIIDNKINQLICMSMGSLPIAIEEILGVNFGPNVMIDRAGNSNYGEKTSRKYGPLVCSRASLDGINTLDQNVLLPNGDVCLCCMDYGMDYVLGNLLESEYSFLFKNEKFQQIMQKLNSYDSDLRCRICNVSISAEVAKDENTPTLEQCRSNFDENTMNIVYNVFDKLFMRKPTGKELWRFCNMLASNETSAERLQNTLMESSEYRGYHRIISDI